MTAARAVSGRELCSTSGKGTFFGYFLCASKESDSGATARETLLLLLLDGSSE
ncbi:MAG TPA: hypothetical protein VFE72_08615 [Lysobacter sp.]|nr:hypothetical protein [Lysobacter sp.]